MDKIKPRNGYFYRSLEDRLKRAINAHPAVIITGPRQVGKSTILKKGPEFSRYKYYNFDSLDTLSAIKQDPEELLKASMVNIIDEVQKFPEILPVIKKIIDDTDRKVRFVLSGSANLLLMRKVSESLAGRAIYMNLYPFSVGEYMAADKDNILDMLLNGKIPEEGYVKGFELDMEDVLWKGLMPVPWLKLNKLEEINEWFDGYITTYLERDLRDVSVISDLGDYKKFLKVMALYNGSIIDETGISREIQIPQSTIHRYLGLLETTCIVAKVQPFEKNRKKRIVKRPKAYWFDTGFVNFLTGNHKPGGLSKKKEYGFLFEAFIYHHLKVWASLKVPGPGIYYWRLRTGEEVDFVVEVDNEIIPIEVKAKKEVGYGDIRNLLEFLSAYPQTKNCLLIYCGDKVIKLSDKIFAVPYSMICVNPVFVHI
jgi:uncharacterized protein